MHWVHQDEAKVTASMISTKAYEIVSTADNNISKIITCDNLNDAEGADAVINLYCFGYYDTVNSIPVIARF